MPCEHDHGCTYLKEEYRNDYTDFCCLCVGLPRDEMCLPCERQKRLQIVGENKSALDVYKLDLLIELFEKLRWEKRLGFIRRKELAILLGFEENKVPGM